MCWTTGPARPAHLTQSSRQPSGVRTRLYTCSDRDTEAQGGTVSSAKRFAPLSSLRPLLFLLLSSLLSVVVPSMSAHQGFLLPPGSDPSCLLHPHSAQLPRPLPLTLTKSYLPAPAPTRKACRIADTHSLPAPARGLAYSECRGTITGLVIYWALTMWQAPRPLERSQTVPQQPCKVGGIRLSKALEI